MLPESDLWSYAIPEPNTGCWLWEGAVDRQGYGRLKNKGAHRISYEMFCGEIPLGACVLHSCDMPSCVNPSHLRPGSRGENAADRARRNRSAPQDGEKNNSAVLTADDVRKIRAESRSAKEAAPDYGISRWHFGRVRRGEYWPQV